MVCMRTDLRHPAICRRADFSRSPDDGSLSLTVTDKDWGYGRLRAHLSPHLNLSQFNAACLDATISNDSGNPENVTFEFGLSSGDGYCVWFLDKAHRVYCDPQDSNPNSYAIDLTNPNLCGATNCAFDIDRVQEAWIASDWGSAEGNVNIAVRGLTFGKSAMTIENPSSYGGAKGPLGWCWRPQSTNPGTSANWVLGSNSTAAQLHGTQRTTVRLVADFADGWVDLSQCKTISLSGIIPSEYINALVLLDIHGAQAQWSLDPKTYSQDITVPPTIWSSNYDYDPKKPDCLYYNMPYFNIKFVRMLGVQIEYHADSNAEMAISDVHFLGTDGQENCAIWTCQ